MMPTALPLSPALRMPLRQKARFGWLLLQERYLSRRMNRVSQRQERIGNDRGRGRLLQFTRRGLAYQAQAIGLRSP